MSDGKPGGSPFGWGFGQPGVRETKVVGETSEIKIPRKQFFETWVFTLLLGMLGYACLKLLITDRGDWSLLVGILTLPALFIGYLFFERQIAYKFFPVIYAEFIAMLQRIASTNDAGRFILFAFFLAVVLLVSIGFYINTIVPQITLILDQQAQIVFVFMAFFSLLFAFVPYYKFNRRQLVDSLRDSDSGYAKLALQLEHDDRARDHEERMSWLKAQITENAQPESVFVQAIPMIKASSTPTAPMTEAQERFRVAVLDFLDGLDQGLWNTNERSWRRDASGRKILPNSKFSLLEVGPMIRDELIRGNWARWKNPDEPQRGWELLYSTQEIRDGAFRYGDKVNPADGEYGEAGSSDFSVIG